VCLNLRTDSQAGATMRTSSQSNWRVIVESLGLPDRYVAVIRAILSEGPQLEFETVLISGSWAAGEAKRDSDFDLVIVTLDKSGKNKVIEFVRPLLEASRGNQSKVDIKILTKPELSRAWNDPHHLVIWTYLRNGVVLKGKNLADEFPLRPEKVRETLGKFLSDTSDILNLLEMRVRFSSACVTLMNALNSFYFTERYILHDGCHPQAKRDVLHAYFGNLYTTVNDIYYQTTRLIRNKFDLGGSVSIPVKSDKRTDPKDYDELMLCCERIQQYGHSVYRKLVTAIDNRIW